MRVTQELGHSGRRHPLEKEGVLEGLISELRIPIFVEGTEPIIEYSPWSYKEHRRRLIIKGHEEVVFCVIPPERTQRGDSFEYIIGTYVFTSPDGQERGIATWHKLTPIQAGRIRDKVTSLSQKALMF